MSIHRILSFPDWLDREYPGVDYINAEKHYIEEYIDYKDNLVEGMTNFEANVMEHMNTSRMDYRERNELRCTKMLEEPIIALNVTPSRDFINMYTTPVYVDLWEWLEFSPKEREELQQDAGLRDEKIIPRRQSTVSYNWKRDLQDWRNQMKRRCEA